MSEEKIEEKKAIASQESDAMWNSWTDAEDSLLREVFPFSTDDELVERMQRSINSIKGRAYRLGIKKHWSFVQKMHKKNAKERWNREQGLAGKKKVNIKIKSKTSAGKL